MTLERILQAAANSLEQGKRRPHCFSAHVPGKGYVNDGTLEQDRAEYVRQAVRAARSEAENSAWAPGYAEPGYTDPQSGVVFANWNYFPRDLDTVLEKAGYAVEWSDEWTFCGTCNKAVRTSPNSYSWTRSYFEDDDCEVTCHECVREDPSAYLEWLEGDSDRAETMGIHLDEWGYVLVGEDYEHGWHPGQNDSPDVIAKSLRERGIEHFIFQIDSVGQFDTRFSVYILREELELLKDAPIASALPYDPGTEMGKALRGEPSVAYAVETRLVTRNQIQACPHSILLPSHYNDDGSCKCAK